MAFCSKCGKELADDAKFCANCGAPVDGAENAESKASVADKMKEAAKNFNAEEKAKAAGEKARQAGSKLKNWIDGLPFNGMAAKVPVLAKVAGFANYAVCVLGVVLLIIIISAITPEKTDSKNNYGSAVTEKPKELKKTAGKKTKQEKSNALIALESKIKEDYGATPEELIAGSFAGFGMFVSDEEITNQLVNYALKDDSAKIKDLEDIIQLYTVMSFDDPSSVNELVRRGKAKVKSLNDKVEQILKEKEIVAKEKEKADKELKKSALKYKKKLSKSLAANKVKIDNFEMLKTEVTQIMYYAVAGSNPSSFIGENLPVEQVSWYDAVIFCNKLSECTKLNPCYSVKGTTDTSKWGNPQRYKWNADKKKFEPDGECDYTPDDIEWNKDADGWRLPTVEEWAKAADDGHKYSGSDTIDEVAWYSQNSGNKPHDVASKKANSNGIYDMSGNVHEWCWDKDEQQEEARFSCSGCYKYSDGDCEVSFRIGIIPTISELPFGIRLVRNAQ